MLKDRHRCTWRHIRGMWPCMVKTLIELGADKEASAAKGSTPLHVAAWQGHVEVVKTLVELKADIGALTNSGETPLQLSIRYSHHHVERVLRGAMALERSARTKKEAEAKKPTQQAIDHAERMHGGTADRGGEARTGRSEEGARLLHCHPRRAPSHPVGWRVHHTRVERIMTRSGDGARTTG
jgi:hypothetical protein